MYHISYSRKCQGYIGQAILIVANSALEAEEKMFARTPDAQIFGVREASECDMKPGKPVIEDNGRLTFVGRR